VVDLEYDAKGNFKKSIRGKAQAGLGLPRKAAALRLARFVFDAVAETPEVDATALAGPLVAAAQRIEVRH
jgi:hypothetical protein